MPSSVIHSYAYDRASAALEVTFFSGRRYRYFLVPPYVADGLDEAFSMGRYFNERIRDRFPFEELATAAEAAIAASAAISPGRGSQRRP